MPAAAWPGTVQRYSYLPVFVRFTTSVALLPAAIIGVALPAHAVAVPPLLLEQTLKSCGRVPLFVTLKVTEPCFTLFVESLNENWFAAGIETLTVVPAAKAGNRREECDARRECGERDEPAMAELHGASIF